MNRTNKPLRGLIKCEIHKITYKPNKKVCELQDSEYRNSS